jgi:hypothetical protein
MPTIKRKYLAWAAFLALGCVYYSLTSNLEVNYFLKSFIYMIPLQVGAFAYVIYFNQRQRRKKIN